MVVFICLIVDLYRIEIFSLPTLCFFFLVVLAMVFAVVPSYVVFDVCCSLVRCFLVLFTLVVYVYQPFIFILVLSTTDVYTLSGLDSRPLSRLLTFLDSSGTADALSCCLP